MLEQKENSLEERKMHEQVHIFPELPKDDPI